MGCELTILGGFVVLSFALFISGSALSILAILNTVITLHKKRSLPSVHPVLLSLSFIPGLLGTTILIGSQFFIVSKNIDHPARIVRIPTLPSKPDIERLKESSDSTFRREIIYQLVHAAAHGIPLQQREIATEYLKAVLDDSITEIIDLLGDSDPSIRYQAARFLRMSTERTPEIVHALLLASESPGRINVPEDEKVKVIQAIASTLSHESRTVRRNAAYELKKNYGADAVVALDSLIQALNDTDSIVLSDIAETLGKIGAEAQPALPALANNLKKNQSPAYMAKAMYSIGPDSIPFLVDCLGGVDYRGRNRARDALVRFGKEALPALSISLKSTRSTHKSEVIATLRALGDLALPTLPDLIESLKDEDAKVRAEAAHTIGAFSTLQDSNIHDILSILDSLRQSDEDSWVRVQADSAYKNLKEHHQ